MGRMNLLGRRIYWKFSGPVALIGARSMVDVGR